MGSSTSHSNGKIPRLACRLLAAAVAAWIAGNLFTLRLNPEVAYDRHAHSVKTAWAQKLDRDYAAKFVVYGGSSCRTSINGQRMLERHNLPVLNAGMAAGLGPKIQTRYALQFARKGDTLVVAIEPGLLLDSLEVTSAGVQFAIATGNPALLRERNHVDWPLVLLHLRPGAYYCFTYLGKIVLRQRMFRYAQSDMHPDGWQEVSEKRHFVPLGPGELNLSKEAKAWLGYVRGVCAERGVRVCYALPWLCSSVENAEEVRKCNARFLIQVARLLPVLKDPMLGAYPVREHFADTGLHLNAAGAAVRSDQLADQLKKWEMWTSQELSDVSLGR